MYYRSAYQMAACRSTPPRLFPEQELGNGLGCITLLQPMSSSSDALRRQHGVEPNAEWSPSLALMYFRINKSCDTL
jgi:hypothetical protein